MIHFFFAHIILGQVVCKRLNKINEVNMCIELAKIVNCIGLIYDLVGVLIIWKYGLPPAVNRSGSIGLKVGVNEKEQKKAKNYDVLSFLGMELICLGFIWQIFSLFL